MPSIPSDLPPPAKPASTVDAKIPAPAASKVSILSWFRRGTQDAKADASQQSGEVAPADAANKQAADWHEMRRAAGWGPLEGNRAK